MNVLGRLRTAGLLVALTGAAGSLWLALLVGHRNQSSILVALFTVWVLSPFGALISAHGLSTCWPFFRQVALGATTCIISLGSTAIDGIVAFGPRRAQPAFALVSLR